MKKSCCETARLLSESRDRRLSLLERVLLRFHLTMCGMCGVYAKQIATISSICQAASEHAPDCCPGKLPEDRKARIRDAMRE